MKWLLALLALYAGTTVSAQEIPSRKAVEKLAEQANNDLTKLRIRESLRRSREALKQSIELGDNYLIATSYNIIAGNYDELSENDKAIGIYKKALAYADRTTNDSIKGWINNNLGNMYFFEKKDYTTGLDYYNRALGFAEKTRDSSKLLLTHLNLALAHFEIHDYHGGAPHLEFLNRFHSKYGDADTVVFLHMLNAIYAASKNDTDRAQREFDTAIRQGKKDKNDVDLSYVYQEYSRFLRSRGQFRQAYDTFALYDSIKDMLYDKDKLERADAEGLNLELDEYKRALSRIEAEKEIQSLSLRKSQIIEALSAIALVVLLVWLYTLYRSYNFKKKTAEELAAKNAQLAISMEKAEEASRLKSQFVSTITHELRTPLYGVIGITNMILDEHRELAGSTHLNSLKFSAKYLLSLVNDILQINKIEENRLKLESLTFNISDEIATIMNSLQFLSVRHNNQIVAEVDTDIPELVIGDKIRLSQIIMNLVSNALKFTTDGEVTVSAQLEKVEGKKHFIRFEIADNGIGIAAAHQDKIFEKFVQIERKTDDYQGTGLGLTIVKKLIEAFGSEIHLESEERKGSRFWFTVPFEVDPARSAEIIGNIEVDLSTGQIFDVLVVEDNKINQVVTRKIIESNNYRCDVADDGYAALVKVQRKTYDVILMDINMPGIDGFETTRQIRALGIQTPVVALTAFGKEEIAEEALSSGINDILIKPFEPVKLFHVISGLMKSGLE